MGRQAYMTRLALGRSAYEPPSEEQSTYYSERAQRRVPDEEQNTNLIARPGYVQQYDRRGHPENLESRALLRQSRRAQNDVLATVGVCVGVDKNEVAVQPQVSQRSTDSSDRTSVQSVMRENEVGLLLAAADMGLIFLGTFWVLGLRQRLQTFHFYSGAPLAAIFKSEWTRFGPLQFLFGGMTARLSYLLLDLGRFLAIRGICDVLLDKVKGITCSRRTTHSMVLGVEMADRILQVATLAFIAPLEIFATLQQLDLIPQWPIFPHLRALIPFTRFSPLQVPNLPAKFGWRSSFELLISLALSPFTLWWTLSHGKPRVEQKLHKYLRCILPKPSKPDTCSIMGALEDELDDRNIPGIGTLTDEGAMELQKSRSFLEEVSKDIQSLSTGIQEYFASWTEQKEKSTMVSSFRENLTTQSIDSAPSSPAPPPFPMTIEDLLNEPIPRRQSRADEEDRPLSSSRHPSRHRSPASNPDRPQPIIINHPARPVPATLPPSSPPHFRPPGTPSESPTPSQPHLPPSHTPSESSVPSPTDPSPNISISTEHISHENSDIDTIQVNIQMTMPPNRSSSTDAQQQNNPAEPTSSPTVTNNIATSAFDPTAVATIHDNGPQPRANTHAPSEPEASSYFHQSNHHRITVLTTYPFDTLASHLATHLTTLLFFPLEALYVRSVARSYLSSPLHPQGNNPLARERWQREVYPPGRWMRAGLRGGRGAWGYVGKMILVMGVEAGVGMVVWEVGVGVAWWLGREWFRWGRL